MTIPLEQIMCSSIAIFVSVTKWLMIWYDMWLLFGMYYYGSCEFVLQKLLLLPELNDNSTTDTDSDPVSRSCSPNVMPTLKLVNDELISVSGHESFLNGVVPRIKVNSLTASWTYVRTDDFLNSYFNFFNSQDKNKLVLEDINFTVDQVRCSSLHTVIV